MRQNEVVAVSTDKVLLVPYDRRHVLTYHGWMEDPAIQQATASEQLTLEEEYENQESWRASHDKMTFIVCQPLPQQFPLSSIPNESKTGKETILAGTVDTPGQMVGDINLFLSPYEDEDDDDDGQLPSQNNTDVMTIRQFVGEVDIMIAHAQNQGKGIGKAAVLAFLGYLGRHLGEILREYYYQGEIKHCQISEPDPAAIHGGARYNGNHLPTNYYEKEAAAARVPEQNIKLQLHSLVAKIHQTNERSIALFKSLGFEQDGEVNFFGEVKLVLLFAEFAEKFASYFASKAPLGYKELVYVRTGAGDEGQ